MSDITTNINKLYNKGTYLDKYGSDVWIAVIICLVFFLITSYYYVLNNIKPISADWDNQKCSPSVIPFAGLINKGANESALDFTSKNFTGCVQTILTGIVSTAFQPVYYIMKNITDTFSELLNSLNSIRGMFDKLRNSIKDFSSEVMARSLNITMPVVQLIINVKSIGDKVIGTLTGALFTLFGSYITLKSLFLYIISLITTILIALGITIGGLLIISFIPIFGSWAIPIAAVNIAIMIAIMVPTLIVQIFMKDILSLSTQKLPSVPSCFAENTLFDVFNGYNTVKTKISDIKVGDILLGNNSSEINTVTAIMKFSAKEQDVYNLDGIFVTGEHRVLHKTLGWIKVKQHPNSVLLREFNEPFVYCLGTETKIFTIENDSINDNNTNKSQQIYSDWDDIDEHVVKCLDRYLNQDIKSDININNYTNIHKYLDNGIIGNALVTLKNHTNVPIKDIQVNDVLLNGEIVLGIIKIDADKLDCIYIYGNNDDTLLGIDDNNHLIGFNISLDESFKRTKIEIYDNYLYQLLTNTGEFTVNGIRVKDYNYCIDKTLF
jgi:hypothetical protein